MIRYILLFIFTGPVMLALPADDQRPPGKNSEPPLLSPLVRSVDLDVGQSRKVTLSDGTAATIKLLTVKENRDPVRNALRGAQVTVEVNGVRGIIPCATYHLPTVLGGVRIDCPVIKGYLRSYTNKWSIDRDARLRIWPKQGPLIRPGTFRYPVDQRWGAAGTLFDNEIADGELYGPDRVYYHQGFDFGGADRIVPIHAATDGLVVSARGKSIPGIPECVSPRYDVVYLRDPRGWYYRYSHFDAIDDAVQPGSKVAIGQQLGILGKEGGSGGWAHLHFELVRPQENGRFGSDSMYAFLHQVYQAENDEPVIAVARPQLMGFTGKSIRLDGSRSWSAAGTDGMQYEWTFDDGTSKTGPQVEHVFSKPGRYRPTLKVTDKAGNIDYDFGKITVADPGAPPIKRCYLHAAYWPTKNIRAGDQVRFLVRSFRFAPVKGDEVWDFGDGSPAVRTRSDGAVDHRNKAGYAVTTHRFKKPGDYIVTVRRTNSDGQYAVEKLDVRVAPAPPTDDAGRPLIRKLGTIDCDLVESTPVVLHGKVYRFHWVRHRSCFNFVERATGRAMPDFAKGYRFGSAFVEGDTAYVTGTKEEHGWYGHTVTMFASKDLKNWTSWTVLDDPKYGICNTSLCKTGDEYVLMFEIHKPAAETGAAFTARFARSKDLKQWTVTGPECVYAKDRYSAPHCLRYLDGYFYNFYLEAHKGYEQRVVRSKDLVHWEPSPLNPVLRHSHADKKIASEKLTKAQRKRIADAVNLNNSDIDFCEYQGKLIINYSWGNQKGVEFLAEAVYEGTLAQFLRGWFPKDDS